MPQEAGARERPRDAQICWYCEDSQANQVEHVRPKSLYPGFAFAWLNLTFACSPCNLSKNDRFAIVLDGVLVPLVRRSDDDEPPDGRIGLLDLRREDPRELVTLDLRDSFHLSARERLDPLLTSRVEYTIEALRLNDDPHPARRHQAYLDYRAALREYLVWREQGRSRGQLDGLRARILRRDQLSVWREVQRQFQADTHFVELDHDFAELFEAVPEALG